MIVLRDKMCHGGDGGGGGGGGGSGGGGGGGGGRLCHAYITYMM